MFFFTFPVTIFPMIVCIIFLFRMGQTIISASILLFWAQIYLLLKQYSVQNKTDGFFVNKIDKALFWSAFSFQCLTTIAIGLYFIYRKKHILQHHVQYYKKKVHIEESEQLQLAKDNSQAFQVET